MKSFSARSPDTTILGVLLILGIAIIFSFTLMPQNASAAAVTVTAFTATSTPAYTNPGLATTTRAKIADTIQYQLTLSGGAPLIPPQINILGTGSTTMSGSGVNWYYATTTTSNASVWNDGLVTFKVSVGQDTLVETATTTVTALTAGSNITFDKTAPTLSSVAWADTDGSTRLSGTDTLLFTWNETMATTTLTGANLNTVLGLTNSHIFSTTTAPTWNTAGTQLTITLGAATTVTGADTVQSTTAVRDAVGNQSSGVETAIRLPAPVGISALTATSTPAYTNTGLATTTRATTGDAVQYQLTLDGTPLVPPQINISDMGSTTMSGSGVNWNYSTTTISGSLSNGAIPFKISVGAVGGTATTTVTALTAGSNITFDKTAPTLSSVAWTDTDGSTQFSATDTFLLTFSETMATTTLTAGNIDTVLGLTNSHIFSTTTAPTWNTAGTQLTITLGTGTTITGLDTVQPTIAVKDAIGNTASGAQTAIVLQDAISPHDPTGLSDTSFRSVVSVSLSSSGSSQIRYTTDGSTPNCSTGLVYSSAIVLPGSTTLKAIGCDEAGNYSSVVTATYTYTSSGSSSSSATPATPTVPAVVPAIPATPASGLSAPQIQSILDVLASFDVDAATMASVKAALEGTTTGSVTSTAVKVFKANLTTGSLGSEVKMLQEFLNAHGYTVASSGPGSSGNETDTFGSLTRAALVKYQKANGITPAVGYFGPLTRAAINAE